MVAQPLTHRLEKVLRLAVDADQHPGSEKKAHLIELERSRGVQ